MEKKINIAKLLKDVPQDYEVDSPIFGKVRIRKVDNDPDYPIDIAYDLSSTGECVTSLTCYGTLTTEFKDAPCVIFPKGEKTWEDFSAPWMQKHKCCLNCKFSTLVTEGIRFCYEQPNVVDHTFMIDNERAKYYYCENHKYIEEENHKHFEPFQKVLVKDGNYWYAAFYDHWYNEQHGIIGGTRQFDDDEICSYEGNESLL